MTVSSAKTSQCNRQFQKKANSGVSSNSVLQFGNRINFMYGKVKFLFVAISGICLGIFKGSHGSHRAAPEPMCLPTMTQAGCNTRRSALVWYTLTHYTLRHRGNIIYSGCVSLLLHRLSKLPSPFE